MAAHIKVGNESWCQLRLTIQQIHNTRNVTCGYGTLQSAEHAAEVIRKAGFADVRVIETPCDQQDIGIWEANDDAA